MTRPPCPAGDFAKRIFDVFFSAAGLLALAPFFAVAALLIKLGDGGPVFYRGVRVGRCGRLFRIFKFRTMVLDAEKMGASTTTRDDQRLTRMGRLLRRGKMDELPQLINVLLGDMSLVGPRPEVEWIVKKFGLEERKLLAVRPGITDFASIKYRRENDILRDSKDPDGDYFRKIAPDKRRLGLKYVRERSIWLDLRLIFETLLAIVGIDAAVLAGEGFQSVTEHWGMPVTRDQLSMACTRYRWAGRRAKGKRVLEVACGAGFGLKVLAREASRVVGGDYTLPIAQEARLYNPDSVGVLQLDGQFLPFRAGTFDVVLMFEAIYYLRSPERFLAECRRVLAEGGEVLVCLPNRERPSFNPSPFSVRYWSAAELVELFRRSGFSAEVFGSFPAGGEDHEGALRKALRGAAVRLGLLPKSMLMKVIIKRLVFGRLPRLDDIQEVSAPEGALVRLSGNGSQPGWKVLYAEAVPLPK